MLPYGARELARTFRTVRDNTLQIVNELPEDKLDFAPADGARTIRQLLSHIAFGDEFANAVHKGRLGSVLELDFPTMGSPRRQPKKPSRATRRHLSPSSPSGARRSSRGCRRSVTTAWPSRSGCPRARSLRPRPASR